LLIIKAVDSLYESTVIVLSSTRSAPSLNELFAGIDFSAMNIAMQRPQTGFRSRSDRVSTVMGYLPTPPHSPYDRQQTQNGNGNGGHRERSKRQREQYQFWPQAMALGSLVGKRFNQVRRLSITGVIGAYEIDPCLWYCLWGRFIKSAKRRQADRERNVLSSL
jgi:hypothetical protein